VHAAASGRVLVLAEGALMQRSMGVNQHKHVFLPKPSRSLVATALLTVASASQAHGAAEGMNAFYAGLLHPFQNLAHMLLLLGLGIWLGQSRPFKIAMPVLACAVGAVLGLLLTTALAGQARVSALNPAWLIGGSLCVGLLIALSIDWSSWLHVASVGMASLAVAADSGVTGMPPLGTLASMLVGTWITIVVLVANVAYYVSICPTAKWVQIAMRILGSWLAAVSVLVLAFYLKG
jgi:hydrogenase/urease accessory protein HupE